MWNNVTYEQYFNNSTNDVSMINASTTYPMQKRMYYAMIDMLISTKINVANPYPVTVASSLRVLLVVNKFTVNKNIFTIECKDFF